MRIKMIEQMRYKLSGRAVPVVKLEDIDAEGRVYTLHLLGTAKRRANSIQTPWDQKTWEIGRDAGKISLIDEKGNENLAYLVTEEGRTTKLFTKPVTYHAVEDIMGKASTMDDIAEAMDLGKSPRQLLIGALLGIGIGAFIIGPMITTILS
jgi:hypothetical protein